MESFGFTLVGKTFRKDRTVFMVMEIDPYPEDRISSQFREKLADLPPQHLVAVAYRGILIPNITLKGGVARLTKVAVAGQTLTGPKAISAALGVNTPYHAYQLQRV